MTARNTETGSVSEVPGEGVMETMVEEAFAPESVSGAGGYDGSMEINIAENFDAEAEYKILPLVPRGVYRANTTNVKFDPEHQLIKWTLCLDGNGGLLSDGETPVDGVTLDFTNFLPKPGDENELTSSGRQTKRQYKINALKEFGDKMKIKITTKPDIIHGLTSGEWIGLAVIVTVGTREYQGRIFNEAKDIKAA